jgi:ketosteroid isomerase-like protein
MSAANGTAEPSPTPTRTPQEWVDGFVAGWRAPAGPREFAEHFRPLLADDVRLVQPQLPPLRGYREFAESFVAPSFALIAGLRGEVERWVATDETIYAELTLHGRIGRRAISFRACDRISLRDGVCVERESYFDPTAILAAVARSPRTWPRFARIQLAQLRRRN